ncbi:MAK10 homologue [Actinidia rufa]|uniref:MAK10 homologue n=1 Tax=Actinidia rufa TaxID=165716 RepID=A0A7J0DA96_9ERIC|nr:MAK10 homologue [Actinidia rufa]
MAEKVKVPINPSIPSGEQTVWADVSSLLDLACKDLRDGELIHGENFNLFAAMSALEIMDPKMDSGIVCTYYSVDEAIESGAAPVPLSLDRTLDVQCTIEIMDHLLACEEEDLFTMAYGLPLKGDGDEKCLSMLHAVEETIARQLRACKAPSAKKRVLEDVETLQTHPDLEEDYCKALLCRIRFRKHFYHVLASMRRPQGRGFELARKHIASCLSELDSILNSSEFLRSNACGPCKDGVEHSTTATGCLPIGFDASLNCRLSAPTPPRSIKILSWRKAIEYFQKLLHDLDIICSYSLDPLLEGVLRFVVEFQKFQPDLVARAHLQLLLVQDGKLYGRDPIFVVISKAAALPEVPRNHDIQKNEILVQLVQLVISLLKILCANAAWQRRKLGKILHDWRVIYIQLELAFQKDLGEISSILNDEKLCAKISKHILIWVEEQTFWIASRFLILGFELELYSPSEYCMVYWYIYVVLIKLAEKTHLKMLTSSETGKRKGRKKKDSLKDLARDYQIPPTVLLLQCQIYLSEGLTMLFQMLASLRSEHKVFPSLGPFNTEHERFIQHFELLQKASIPDHISYLSYKESTTQARSSNLDMHNCFKDARRIAKELRSSFSNDQERMAELRRIEQVAEHNGVALNLICRLGTLDPSLKVYFEFCHHPYFATAVVKRS